MNSIPLLLERNQLLFEETGNPLFAWSAVRLCLANDHELPLWCKEFILQISLILMKINLSISRYDTKKKHINLTSALGFRTRGRCAFAEYSKIIQEEFILDEFEELLEEEKPYDPHDLEKIPLMTRSDDFANKIHCLEKKLDPEMLEILCSEHQRRCKGVSATEAELILAERYGVIEITTVRRWLSRERKRRKKLRKIIEERATNDAI